MALEFIEGFDYLDPAGLEVEKYAPYVQSGPGLGSFYQVAILPGRFSGHSLQIINTGFGEYLRTKRLALHTKKTVGLAFMHSDPFGGGYVRSLWLRFNIGNMPQMAIQIDPTGMLQLVRGVNFNTASTGIVQTFFGPIVPSQWYYLEVAMEFDSPGKVFIWIDGVLVVSEINFNTTPNGTGCDAISRRWQNFGTIGMVWDDHYILGDTLERLGPSRVLSALPTSDFRALWTPSAGTDHFRLMDDPGPGFGAPDDDQTYVQSNGGGDDLFGLASVACVGKIWGVALNAASKITSFSQGITLVGRDGDGNTVNFGGIQQPFALNQYNVLQGISEEDNHGTPWNPRLLDSCAFGVSAVGSGERVSQVYLEALTTLDTSIPFDCGAHSYGY